METWVKIPLFQKINVVLRSQFKPLTTYSLVLKSFVQFDLLDGYISVVSESEQFQLDWRSSL